MENIYRLLDEHNLTFHEIDMPTSSLKGLIIDEKIYISKDIETEAERVCVLAEEIAHYQYSAGDILDQNDLNNRKQERLARGKSYEMLISLQDLINVLESRVRNVYEAAEILNVDEKTFIDTIEHYRLKYGQYVNHNKYTIILYPFIGIVEKEK